ncbi:MAG TPA: hypothetical protein VE616_19995 [Candidatus Udaeobacter sp.]|nr:hypothetical protein [Candidatus Udaeobacter sp.]
MDNLRVPEGGNCTLNGGHVKGSVKVEARATLYAREVRVAGNVQADERAAGFAYPGPSDRWERAGEARRLGDATPQYR